MRIAMLGLKGLPVPHSGVERQVVELGRRLAAMGHEVTAFCRPQYTEAKGSYEGIKIRLLPSVNTKHLDAITHTAAGTLATLFSGYDVVHYHAIGPSLFSLLPRAVGSKTVVTVHGLDWQRDKWGGFASRVLRLGEWTSANFPDRTIVVSKTLKQYYDSKYGKSVAYIPNGITLPEVLPPDKIKRLYGIDGGDYLLFVARLVPEKGCHHLIEAFRKTDTKKKLVIAGGSSHTEQYVASLKGMASGDSRIVFTGHVHGEVLGELFSNAYLYVQPSLIEGLSIALLEALSYGLGALVSDIPENREVIEQDGEEGDWRKSAGFTFRAGDASDLQTRLESLLGDEALVTGRAEGARAYVSSHYDWDLIARQTEGVYLDICRGKAI